jgi:3-oxoadipate enol-lactonase
MPVTSSQPKLQYVRDGTGPPVLLSHAVGCSLTMWDEIVPALARRFTVIRWDARGHGGSEAADAPFSISDLIADAVRVLDELTVDRVSWIGLSLGGMIGQGLAIEHPDRVARLVLANTVSRFSEEARAQWRERGRVARSSGMTALADLIMTRYFSPHFRRSDPDVVERFRTRVLSVNASSYAGFCDAIAALDWHPRLHRVACPTLAIAGGADRAATPAMVKEMADRIPAALLETIPEAGHLSVVEQPGKFLEIVEPFLGGQPR